LTDEPTESDSSQGDPPAGKHGRGSLNAGSGVALGAGIGAALGVAFGNIAIGVAVGVALGTALGVASEKKRQP